MSSGVAGERMADGLWQRVRELERRVAQWQARVAEDDDEALRARLERERVRLARAVDRARLGDELADQLADAAVRRARRVVKET